MEQQVIDGINTLDINSLKRIRSILDEKLKQETVMRNNLIDVENLMETLWQHYISSEFRSSRNHEPRYETVGCFSLTRDQFNSYLGPLSMDDVAFLSKVLNRRSLLIQDRFDILSRICYRALNNSYKGLYELWRQTH